MAARRTCWSLTGGMNLAPIVTCCCWRSWTPTPATCKLLLREPESPVNHIQWVSDNTLVFVNFYRKSPLLWFLHINSKSRSSWELLVKWRMWGRLMSKYWANSCNTHAIKIHALDLESYSFPCQGWWGCMLWLGMDMRALHNVYHLYSVWQSYHPVHCRHASGSAEYHVILTQLLCALFF